ncbi:hypothetical protein V2A60_010356 [Cordyceps javanica]
MYRSLLLQLLEQRPELQDIFDSPKLKPPTGRFGQWSIDSVQAHFELAVQRVEGLTIMCFIDALDECDEDEVRDMVSFFERLGESSVNGDAQLFVCFASRHYPHITLSKGLYLVLERQSGHDQDISSYLDETLKLGHGEFADQIRAEVQRKASGVFMWVVLVVQILNKEFDRGRLYALKKKLRQIPSNLHQLFRDILSRGDTNQDESLLCIKWILFAAEPLTPAQLYFGLLAGLEPEELGRWNRDVITSSVMERYILDCSKGLAEVTAPPNPRVQFIHESVKDFLLKDNGFSDLWPELVAGFEGQSHESLKWCCFNYIEIDIYAALAIESSLPEEGTKHARNLNQKDFTFSSSHIVPAYLTHKGDEPMVVAFVLALDDADLESKDEVYGHTVLSWAARNGHDAVVRLLLEKGPVDTETKCYNSWTPLSWASWNGHEAVVERLLDIERTNADPKDSLTGWTALALASKNGHVGVVKLLLQTQRVNVNAADNHGKTPLSWAAWSGKVAVVRLLLEAGAFVESKDSNGQTPLSFAAGNGHEAVVRALLQTGRADVESRDIFAYEGN